MDDPSTPAVRQRRGGALRGRLLLVSAAVALLVVSGSAVERTLGSRSPAAGRPSGAVSGAWFCPHGGEEGWQAWVALANPGPDPARVRVTTFGIRGARARASFDVPGERLVYREVPAGGPAAATLVEFFGAWVGAGSVVRSGEEGAATAAGRCLPAARQTWYLTDASTLEGFSSDLVLMNPFGQDAVLDVVIRTDDRPAVTPSALTQFVLTAGTSTAVRLNRFVLQAPDEEIMTVEVRVRIGRVAAGTTVASAGSLRSEPATGALAPSWFLPAGGHHGASVLELLNPTERRADLTVIAHRATSQEVVSGVGEVFLPGEDVLSYTVEEPAGTGVLVESARQAPVIAGRRVAGASGDRAAIGGSARPFSRWLVLPAAPPSGGRAVVVLQNPGPEDARVGLALIGTSGPLTPDGALTVSVPAGRSRSVDLSEATDGAPVAVTVEAEAGTIVAATASYSRGGEGFGSTLGVAMRPAR